MSSWEAWRLDPPTWAWIVWGLWFLGWETYGVVAGYEDTLTAHLRPVFTTHDLVYFLAVALWLWLGWHVLVDGLWIGAAARR